MSEERSRVEIGFDGGLIVVVKVKKDGWKQLEDALASGTGRVQVEGEDDIAYYVDVSKVSYVKHELHVGKVGF